MSHLELVGQLDAVVVGRGEAGGQGEHGDEREEGLFEHHFDFDWLLFWGGGWGRLFFYRGFDLISM